MINTMQPMISKQPKIHDQGKESIRNGKKSPEHTRMFHNKPSNLNAVKEHAAWGKSESVLDTLS